VYLHGVADPGNVGAILRCAHAFGAACVALGPQTADPFSPKAVRASMGAVFAVPVVRGLAVAELPGVKVALDPRGDAVPLADTLAAVRGERPAAELTLLVGAERTGLPSGILRAADHVARIPIASDSLNAAMATAVALYEVTRPPVVPARKPPGPTTRMAPP